MEDDSKEHSDEVRALGQSGSEIPAIGSLGEYELVERLARGGTGVVYSARQRKLKRMVALKLLAGSDVASSEFVERFQREARAAASLEHPNIVPIYEIGEWEGQSFLCMKLVKGLNLAQRIALGPRLTAEQTGRIMIKLARAVHYAHQRGVVHRDLKPSNVLLDAADEPYLTDFGLAKLRDPDFPDGLAHTLTLTLAVLGTPAYMSPEQASGNTKNISTAVDIYGLGAVLYELLSGEPPFTGTSTIDIIRRVLDKQPRPPSQCHPRTPIDLQVICLKCLEKDPRHRYGSAEAVAEEVERWMRHEPITARASPPAERVWKWVCRNPMRASLTGSTFLASLALLIGMSVMSVRLANANKQIKKLRSQIIHAGGPLGPSD